MCTETFLRLPEEKRNRFLDAAWEEFTTTPLKDASINKIVRRAKIPRGSFYQYFSDKDDLFAYLQGIVLKHLISEYRGVMKQADGDLFQTQILCFERIASLGSAADVLFDRCIRILRLNPGLLPQVAMENQPVCHILDAVWDQIDTSNLRSQEHTFVSQTFMLTLVSLAFTVMDCLTAPENVEQYRQALLTRLDIIKRGSLAESSRESI